MLETERTIIAAYASALGEFLRDQDESALQRAYEMGRRALEEGRGLVDLASIHHHALAALLSATPSGDAALRLTDLAGTFFTECLSPFEMSLRGFRDANRRLLEVNQELHRANILASDANRELEAFSYSVAHDLRAPLRSIAGFTAILAEDHGAALNAEGQAVMRRVLDATARMGGIIDALLTLSRLSRAELRVTDVNLTEVAQELFAALREQEPARVVRCDVEPDLHVRGDEHLLRQLLQNLIGNAWKFTRATPEARIDVGEVTTGEGRAFFVADNGAGFDMTYAAKLFQPFQRLHSVHEFEGTGIGLATVRRIVERHGGRVTAEGAPGQGSKFVFSVSPKL
jgi:light-regulated signal transduction histidine kinase (bacteriophytochrome)